MRGGEADGGGGHGWNSRVGMGCVVLEKFVSLKPSIRDYITCMYSIALLICLGFSRAQHPQEFRDVISRTGISEYSHYAFGMLGAEQVGDRCGVRITLFSSVR